VLFDELVSFRDVRSTIEKVLLYEKQKAKIGGVEKYIKLILYAKQFAKYQYGMELYSDNKAPKYMRDDGDRISNWNA
jgi:hypothetical protein